jgi:C-terminal processing protease CtpA/Prc
VTGATVAITLGQTQAQNDASGVGIIVVHVAEGSDAEHSGVARGDQIVRIDGVAPRSLDEARSRLSGTQGSNVLVELDREGNPLTLRLLREQVRR